MEGGGGGEESREKSPGRGGGGGLEVGEKGLNVREVGWGG